MNCRKSSDYSDALATSPTDDVCLNGSSENDKFLLSGRRGGIKGRKFTIYTNIPVKCYYLFFYFYDFDNLALLTQH